MIMVLCMNLNGIDEDPEYEQQILERELNMAKIEMSFANEAVILTYCKVLKQYQELDDRVFYQIANMFHRIFVKCRMEGYFYKVV
jgi:hypothetical protein